MTRPATVPVHRPTVRLTAEATAAASAALAQPCPGDACDQLVPAAVFSFHGTPDRITANVLGAHVCPDGEVRVVEAHGVPVSADQLRGWLTGGTRVR